MNKPIRRATLGAAIALGTFGIGASTANAADIGFTTPGTTPPPPPRDAKLVAAPPQPSTTCEGDAQCANLKIACFVLGGTYNGWHSTDPGHDHEHGKCTWPWE